MPPTPTAGPGPRQAWVWAAATATVLALGLPWGGSATVPGVGGATGLGGGVPGAEHPARVGILLVLVLGLAACRTGRRAFALAGLVAAAVTVAVSGLVATGGVLALLAGAVGFWLAAAGPVPTETTQPAV